MIIISFINFQSTWSTTININEYRWARTQHFLQDWRAQQRLRSGCIFAKAHQSSFSAWWCFGSLPTVFSTSLRKAFFFCLPSCFKRKHFVLIRNHLSFLILIFLSNIYSKIIYTAKKNGLTYYANSIVKWFFGFFVWENIFYFSSLSLNYSYFTTILWKFQKNWICEKYWKSASKLLILQISV